MVMVISLGLNRSPPHYLYGSSGPVRRSRRASNVGKEEPSLARPRFAGLSRLRYGIISPPLALGGEGVEVRPVRVRPFLAPIRVPAGRPQAQGYMIWQHLQTCARMQELTLGIQNHIGFKGSLCR